VSESGLSRLLSRLFGRPAIAPARMTEDDAVLEQYFTNAEEARSRFEALIQETTLSKRVFVIHGVGAVGKTTLLRMLRLRSRREGIAVAIVSADDAPSVADLLGTWARELGESGLRLERFDALLTRYREVERKGRAEAQRAGIATEQAGAVDALATAAGKGALKVAAGIVVPVVGPVLEAVGEEAAGAAINLLRSKLNRDEFELFLDPVAPLTDAFVVDITHAANGRRAALMLDTFDALTTLRDWMRAVVRRMPQTVLVVVAGRVLPDWASDWPAWMAQAEIVELREMTDDDLGRLVERYHAAIGRGAVDPERVREVVAFSRGLPLAATTAVELLAVAGDGGGLLPAHAVLQDLGEKLLADVPDEMRSAVEAAALLRTFNEDSLQALLGEGVDAHAAYRELRRWPFTRPRVDGMAVHDSICGVIGEAMLARSPVKHRTLHDRAAAYYAALLGANARESDERAELEMLYHRVRADEVGGLLEWRAAAERYVRHQRTARLRTLLNDAGTYPLRHETSSLWLRYYTARLYHLEGRVGEAEGEYRSLGELPNADRALRAYALCDLGSLLVEMDRLARPGGEARAREAIEQSIRLAPATDTKLIGNEVSLMHLANVRGAWDESLDHVGAMRRFAEGETDAFGLVMTDRLRAGILGLRGDWPGSLAARKAFLEALQPLGEVPALRMHALYLTWPLIFMGRLREAERSVQEALTIADQLDEREVRIAMLEALGLTIGLQERYPEAEERFSDALNFHANYYANRDAGDGTDPDRYIRATLGFRALVALRHGSLAAARSDLERALQIKTAVGDRMGMPEVHVWLGQIAELEGSATTAEQSYRNALVDDAIGRRYFACAALTGLARVTADQGRRDECADVIADALKIAQLHDYNDLAASLLLTRGRLAWEGLGHAARRAIPKQAQQDARDALVHALRFNRFLLDEVLVGRAGGSVFRPLVADWSGRGPAGRRALDDLRTWWATGRNVLDDEPPSTVSTLEPGIQLGEAERLSRQNEPGTGDPQRSVLEHLDAALA